MNTTLEKDLVRNLLKYNNDHNEVPDYPRLNPDVVKSMSKSITKIVYESIRNDNHNMKQNRDAIISLLSKWSKPMKHGHVRVDETNRDDFISSLRNNESNEVFNRFVNDINKNSSDTNIWDDIIGNFEKQSTIEGERQIYSDLIRVLDNRYLEKSGFDCNVLVRGVKTEEETLATLREISKSDRNEQTARFDPSKSILFQKDSNPTVGLGYSLLNLRRNEENGLLKQIVNDIVTNEMNEVEYNFIDYLWSREVGDDIYDLLLMRCPFLYEKPIIKLGTTVLNADESTLSIDRTCALLKSNLKRFLKKTNGRDRLYYKLLSCFYELYTISGYDRRLLHLLTSFKVLMETKV